MIRITDRNVQQQAILTVVRAACLVFVLGVIGMFWLTDHGKAIPDQYDRVVNLAGVGALALLGRVSDSKSDAKEAATAAAEKVTDDLSKLNQLPGAPDGPPLKVEGIPGGEPVPVAEAAGDPPEPPELPPGPFRRR